METELAWVILEDHASGKMLVFSCELVLIIFQWEVAEYVGDLSGTLGIFSLGNQCITTCRVI